MLTACQCIDFLNLTILNHADGYKSCLLQAYHLSSQCCQVSMYLCRQHRSSCAAARVAPCVRRGCIFRICINAGCFRCVTGENPALRPYTATAPSFFTRHMSHPAADCICKMLQNYRFVVAALLVFALLSHHHPYVKQPVFADHRL